MARRKPEMTKNTSVAKPPRSIVVKIGEVRKVSHVEPLEGREDVVIIAEWSAIIVRCAKPRIPAMGANHVAGGIVSRLSKLLTEEVRLIVTVVDMSESALVVGVFAT